MKKTVLITGASSGFGKLASKEFHTKGWNVIATMRAPQKETELTNTDGILVSRLDVTQTDTISSSIVEGITRFGTIDVLINNAGYGAFGIFEESSEEEIDRQVNTNQLGVLRATRAILPHFRERGEGIVMNVTSAAGRFATPYSSLYNMTKYAVEGLSEALYYELAHFGIQVKLIEPGYFKTNFTNAIDFNEGKALPELDEHRQMVKDGLEEAMGKFPAGDPTDVAKVMFKAATDGKKKLRYPVGTDAKAITFLQKTMPFGLTSMFVNNQFKLKKK